MICTELKDLPRFEPLLKGLAQAVEFLKAPGQWPDFYGVTNLEDLPLGKWPLGDGLFVSVEEVTTHEPDDKLFESHRRFVDLQMTLKGQEIMGWAPLSHLEATGPWSDKDDIGFFRGEGFFIEATRGRCVLFFPEDGHQPCVAPGKPSLVKKLVIKIPVEVAP